MSSSSVRRRSEERDGGRDDHLDRRRRVAGYLDPTVSADSKMIAAAIAQAGAQIALALNAARDSD